MNARIYQWRCTFPDRYPPKSPGYQNVSARQGYYVMAETASEAAEQLIKSQLAQGRIEFRVDVQRWGHDGPVISWSAQ